jgi:Asp-tRNA(Asn)/Glu-tRNA(Gln) amidotransferase A subunit family amidase
MELHELTASAAARAIREGRISSEALIRSCLERIAEREPEVKAWLHLDPALSISYAREADKRSPMGPLHGIPFGAKDVIDTVDMPTSQNSPIYQGHRPAKDAACVSVLRSVGAVLLGKTDTNEFAAGGRNAATRNPVNLEHTPGGSSSGSAAAVADLQVPIALGTQTGGSHIRPASYNGLFALKPTWGSVSMMGVRPYSPSADTLGWFGRCVADLVLVASAFRLEDVDTMRPAKIGDIRVGVCRSPAWSHIEPAGERALTIAAGRLQAAGAKVRDYELPALFDDLSPALKAMRRMEGRATFLDLYLSNRRQLNELFVEHCEDNLGLTSRDLLAAYELAESCRLQFGTLFSDIDVLLTPAAPGEAPKGLKSIGDNAFNSIWTGLHAPCLAVPCVQGPNGLPVGVQLVAPRHRDAALLSIGLALETCLTESGL